MWRVHQNEENLPISTKIAWEYVLPYKHIPILETDVKEVNKLSAFLQKYFSTEALEDAFRKITTPKKHEYKIEQMAVIYKHHIHSDVLDRLDGNEEYEDYFGNKIYKMDTIKQILTDPEDDTNESTKILLEELYRNLTKTGVNRILITTGGK